MKILPGKIYVAGHNGMVGSAILRNLRSLGHSNFVLRSSSELDLTCQSDTERFFETEKPAYVFLAAAKVGGIVANDTYRAQFIYENLAIQNNIIHCSWKYGVKKLLFLGSSCIYPREAPQPMKEEYLLTGPLEKTNEPYAIAKIAGIKMCESYYRQYGCNFISVMPTNLYGPNDNYDLEKSHVLPALIRKMHLGKCLENDDWQSVSKDLDRLPVEGTDGKAGRNEIIDILAKYGIRKDAGKVSVQLWGTGNPKRELLHVEDMADACLHIMNNVDAAKLYGEMQRTHINIGTGTDMKIKELAGIVKEVTGFGGDLLWDKSKPDGTPRKQLDVTLLKKLGWEHSIEPEEGIRSVYEKYL